MRLSEITGDVGPMRDPGSQLAKRRSPPLPGVKTFRQHEIVRLVRKFSSCDGVVPEGTEATVLQVFGRGAAYQVEFEGPWNAPETVERKDLERIGATTS